MRKFLVTGGAGFIGSSLVSRLLQDSNEVVLVDNFNSFYDPRIKERNIHAASQHERCHVYRTDIENRDALREIFESHAVDCVVHLAARAGVRPSIEEPELYYKTNVLGTVNILELMKQFRIPKLVFASSSSVYGDNEAETFDENLGLSKPISPYAATKLAGEQICHTYSKLHDISVICLRFFTVYGPRQRPDLAIHKFTKMILNNQPIPMFGDGSSKRDYTYIYDIINGVISAIEYNKTQQEAYEIVNLGGGESVTLKQMIATIENILGKKAIVDMRPFQPGDVKRTACCLAKAKDFLNYTPTVQFTDGVAKFIDWYRKNFLKREIIRRVQV